MKTLKLIVLILLTANFVMAQPAGSYYAPNTNINDASKYNTYVGKYVLQLGTGGTGIDAQNNVGANFALGAFAFREGVGTHNAALGYWAGARINGNKNLAIGTNAGKFFKDGNVAIGYAAGVVATGSGNVLIGHEAGYNIGGANNQLYIHNTSDIITPLIYGDFAKKQVGIGTSDVPDEYAFAVKGHIVAEEVTINLYDANNGGWPDYVFAEDYNLMPLTDLEAEIKTLGHLPGVPSAEEVEENGHALGQMDAILLEKIEELTLHLIKINKEVEALRQENVILKNNTEQRK